MNKIAEEVKIAEVRGCMAAFVDAGLVKVANEEAFDTLCNAVSQNLDDNYNLEKVASVTESILSNSLEKTSAETARNAALGELLLMKTAGQIDDSTFFKTAEELMKKADLYWDGKNTISTVDNPDNQVLKRTYDPDAQSRLNARSQPGMKLKGNKAILPHGAHVAANKVKNSVGNFLSKHKGKLGVGGALTGALATGVLADHLYNKYSK